MPCRPLPRPPTPLLPGPLQAPGGAAWHLMVVPGSRGGGVHRAPLRHDDVVTHHHGWRSQMFQELFSREEVEEGERPLGWDPIPNCGVQRPYSRRCAPTFLVLQEVESPSGPPPRGRGGPAVPGRLLEVGDHPLTYSHPLHRPSNTGGAPPAWTWMDGTGRRHPEDRAPTPTGRTVWGTASIRGQVTPMAVLSPIPHRHLRGAHLPALPLERDSRGNHMPEGVISLQGSGAGPAEQQVPLGCPRLHTGGDPPPPGEPPHPPRLRWARGAEPAAQLRRGIGFLGPLSGRARRPPG